MKINIVKMFKSPICWAMMLGVFVAFVGCKTTEPVSYTTNNKVDEKVVPKEDVKEDSLGSMEKEPEGIIRKPEFIRNYSVVHQIGDRAVDLVFWRKEGNFTLINLHDDENTSVMAAKQIIDSIGGRLIELQHTGERNIKFDLKGNGYEFDPNRMFTNSGAEASLKRFGKISEEALTSVRNFANRIVDSLDQRMIVTLHNNSEDNYSSLSYLDEYRNDAAEVFINPNMDPDDFFFVTTEELFEQFKDLGYNVVLQNNLTMTDDGSLSVLAGRKNIPYVNVEAQHGHLSEQVEMLYVLIKVMGN